MTEKQKRFADEYLIDCNATRAYKAAYPSTKKDVTARVNGSKLLTNANIKAYIDEQLEKIHDEKTADAKEVMEYLTSVMRGEHSDEVLRLIGDGVQVKDSLNAATKDRLRAAELLGKRYGLFTDKLNISGEAPVIIIDDLDDLED